MERYRVNVDGCTKSTTWHLFGKKKKDEMRSKSNIITFKKKKSNLFEFSFTH